MVGVNRLLAKDGEDLIRKRNIWSILHLDPLLLVLLLVLMAGGLFVL